MARAAALEDAGSALPQRLGRGRLPTCAAGSWTRRWLWSQVSMPTAGPALAGMLPHVGADAGDTGLVMCCSSPRPEELQCAPADSRVTPTVCSCEVTCRPVPVWGLHSHPSAEQGERFGSENGSAQRSSYLLGCPR